MGFNFPTWLTLFRLALVPFVIGVLFIPFPGNHYLAAGGFGLAVATDWFDGWLARRWNQTTDFGAFLDPVADKLLVCVVLVGLVYCDPKFLLALPATVIIGREITVSALREWMAELGQRGIVAVGVVGKYKTAIQMLALFIMLYDLALKSWLYDVGVALLWLAAVLTLWSMLMYLRAAWPQLHGHKRSDENDTP